jgi:U2-associated protein SR140
MEGKDNPKEFPDVSQKLAAPKKLSQFEKDRQAAQAKQQRAEEENAAALKAFQSSFDADDDEGDLQGS